MLTETLLAHAISCQVYDCLESGSVCRVDDGDAVFKFPVLIQIFGRGAFDIPKTGTNLLSLHRGHGGCLMSGHTSLSVAA